MFEKLTYNDSTIHFGPLHSSEFEHFLASFDGRKKVILTDENVFEHWITDLTTNYPSLSKAEIIQLPAGEEYKTIEVCTQVWSALSEYEFGRNDLLINFGGGVITDLGGFVASLFKRGMSFVNIPTTLLSMVDASLGGKTGVDLGPYKNQVGLFSDPKHVFIDDRYLETLADEQLYSGYAEMLKHGLIADKDYWVHLAEFNPTLDTNRLNHIYRSVNIKKSIVEQDSRESGLRKVLNFGHTVGHGIEGYMLSKGTPILHGYGVAAGMRAEAFISHELKMISAEEYQEIDRRLQSVFPSVELNEQMFKDIIKLMYNDKKNDQGIIQFALLNGIGECKWDVQASDKLVLNALKTLL